MVARTVDHGADLVATFSIAGAFQFKVAVQAKHWQPKPPVGAPVVDQLIKGMDFANADLGLVITSGEFDSAAEARATEYFDETGNRIELINGELLATLIIEHGLARAVS